MKVAFAVVFFICLGVFVSIKTVNLRIETMRTECSKLGGELTHLTGSVYICTSPNGIIKLKGQP